MLHCSVTPPQAGSIGALHAGFMHRLSRRLGAHVQLRRGTGQLVRLQQIYT